MNRWNQSGR
jgi:hypothetical protein